MTLHRKRLEQAIREIPGMARFPVAGCSGCNRLRRKAVHAIVKDWFDKAAWVSLVRGHLSDSQPGRRATELTRTPTGRSE